MLACLILRRFVLLTDGFNVRRIIVRPFLTKILHDSYTHVVAHEIDFILESRIIVHQVDSQIEYLANCIFKTSCGDQKLSPHNSKSCIWFLPCCKNILQALGQQHWTWLLYLSLNNDTAEACNWRTYFKGETQAGGPCVKTISDVAVISSKEGEVFHVWSICLVPGCRTGTFTKMIPILMSPLWNYGILKLETF